jgi:hypothetical protein
VKRLKFISFVLGSRFDLSEIGDERFEVPRDAADGGVPCRQLVLHTCQFLGEARGQGLNGLLFGLLPKAFLACEHRIDRRVEIVLGRHP